MYQDIAAAYDTIFPFNPAVIACITRFLPPGRARILDIGCGTGKYTAALAPAHDIIGIDPDRASIEYARQRFPDVTFQTADLFSADLAPGFSLIYCIGNTIAHVPGTQMEDFIGRVYNLLQPGGAWIFHTMNWDQILAGEAAAFPVISRQGVTFRRRYSNVSSERVRFETRLETSEGTQHDGSVELFPLDRARIDALHARFRAIAAMSDYAGQPCTNRSPAVIRAYSR